MADGFDLCGVLRRIRRTADLSQRELAAAAGLSASAVGHAEAGTRDLPSRALARAAEVAGLRLALLDADGREVSGMDPDGARDATRRRLPAHLDTQHTDEVADRWAHRLDREQPWFTFGLDRAARDRQRARAGTPEDHDVPRPGGLPGRAARPAAGGRAPPGRGGPGAPARDRRVAGPRTPDLHLPAGVRRGGRRLGPAQARRGLCVWLRPRLTRCYRCGVRGSLLLTRRGEALS